MRAIFKIVFVLIMISSATSFAQQKPLLIFAGAASKPPLEELASKFEKKTGQGVEIVFGGSGYVLSQMILGKQGDIYFPGSSDFMEIAKDRGVILKGTEKKVVYLVPAINVQRGNPKKIHTLRDLTKDGLKIVIARPDTVCIGLYAVELIENNLSAREIEKIRRNIVNYAESCEKTATLISLKTADAAIGWSVFHYWDPERIETVPLPGSQILRIGYLPVAISRFTKDASKAQNFIDFITSPEGRQVFQKHHYFITPEEAFQYVGGEKPIGGEYRVPPSWVGR